VSREIYVEKNKIRGCHGCDRIVVATTYAISANYHWSCEFEFRS